MVGGFGLRGCPDDLIDALVATNKKDLTIISNDLGSPGIGLGKLLSNNQIKALIGNFYNWNTDVAEANNSGKIKVTLIPQGSFAESIRAAGCGIPAYFTLASAGTELGEGKETREYNGKKYVLEEALYADVALIKAEKADELGNLIYCKSARNFNPAMATAANYTIAQVSEIVKAGELDPEAVVTPHIFVNAIVKGDLT
jgi:3-oxoacid CoA-transferase A subunit